jgi:multisubunit Na+/H+ antiporter MnhG subunit
MNSATLKTDDKQIAGTSGSVDFPLSDNQMAEKLAVESPEGRPADKGLHKRGIYLALAVVAVVLMASVALVFLLGGNPQFAIMAAVLALMAAVWSPVVWSALMRAEERGRADKQHDSEVKGTSSTEASRTHAVPGDANSQAACLNGGRPATTQSPDQWSPG